MHISTNSKQRTFIRALLQLRHPVLDLLRPFLPSLIFSLALFFATGSWGGDTVVRSLELSERQSYLNTPRDESEGVSGVSGVSGMTRSMALAWDERWRS